MLVLLSRSWTRVGDSYGVVTSEGVGNPRSRSCFNLGKSELGPRENRNDIYEVSDKNYAYIHVGGLTSTRWGMLARTYVAALDNYMDNWYGL